MLYGTVVIVVWVARNAFTLRTSSHCLIEAEVKRKKRALACCVNRRRKRFVYGQYLHLAKCSPSKRSAVLLAYSEHAQALARHSTLLIEAMALVTTAPLLKAVSARVAPDQLLLAMKEDVAEWLATLYGGQ